LVGLQIKQHQIAGLLTKSVLNLQLQTNKNV